MQKIVSALTVAAALLFAAPAIATTETPISPTSIDGATTITPDDAKVLFDRGVPFVDVRSDSDWEAGRVPGATHLFVKTVFSEETLAEVAGKNDEVVIYCNGPKCPLSTQATIKAVAWGYTKVYFFRTGFPSWQAAGNPVE